MTKAYAAIASCRAEVATLLRRELGLTDPDDEIVSLTGSGALGAIARHPVQILPHLVRGEGQASTMRRRQNSSTGCGIHWNWLKAITFSRISRIA